MTECIEIRTSNGHIVVMDQADWITIRPLLEAGLRLQSVPERGRVKVILREYARGSEPQRTMLLSKVLLGASERQVVSMLNGPLDHRRESMALEDAGRRQAWSSRVHAAQRAQRLLERKGLRE
jgi:hypothetical protein